MGDHLRVVRPHGCRVVPKGPASADDAAEEQVDAREEAVLLFPLAILKPLVVPVASDQALDHVFWRSPADSRQTRWTGYCLVEDEAVSASQAGDIWIRSSTQYRRFSRRSLRRL